MAKPRVGSVQKLGRNHYKVWYYAGGNRRSKTLHGTEAEAWALLAALTSDDHSTGVSRPSERLLLRDFYDNHYHPYVKANRAPRTVEGYESQWRLAEPLFGDEDMHTLTARVIEARIQTLPTPGKQEACFKIMRQLFTRAYRRDFIEANPMSKQIERKRMPYFQRDVYTADELRTIVEAIHGWRFEAAVILCALAGLRRSEACALLWGDVDLADGVALIHVDKTWQRARGGISEQPTKTPKSTRTVALAGHAAVRLAELSDGASPSHGVVSEPRPNPDTVTRAWKSFCGERGFRYVSLQGLRATYSTLLSQAGATDAVVSDSMGHAVLSTRYRHYMNRSVDARIALAHDLTALLLHLEKPCEGPAEPPS